MLGITKKKWKKYSILATIVFVSIVITLLLGEFRFFQHLHLKALDAHFVARGREPTSGIVLLVIDQKALDHFEELQLFWHPYYAEAIRGVAEGGAKVLGLDVIFAVPVTKWEPEHDRMLAEAVADTASRMPVICGYAPAVMSKQQEWPVPVNMIASALGMTAFANLTADPDDFVRRQELIETPVPGSQVPPARSLALRLAEVYLGTQADFDGTRFSLGGGTVPVSRDRAIAINYAGPPGAFPRISLWDFLQAARAGRKEQIRQWVEGKVVLLGPDNITDRYATPFYTAFSGPRWTTAGVEIHANTLHTLLIRRFLTAAPQAGRMLALAAATGGAVAIVASFSAAAAGLWLTLLLAGVIVFTHILFRFGVLLSTSELVLSCAFSVLFAITYRFLTAQTRGELFSKAVNLFIGRQLAVSLEDTQSITLTAKHAFVTILFSDIRGFTAFSESKEPEVVVERLNEYLTVMVRIIMNHHGHVNKFLGDGILAVFTDDDGTNPGDHPVRAVRCGTEMCLASSEFRTGVGIHTGPVVIGNVGSTDRMEYTVLGDTVNLASRLESLNKEHHSQLIMSDSTKDRLDGQVATAHLASVAIRGRVNKLDIFTVSALASNQGEQTVTQKAP